MLGGNDWGKRDTGLRAEYLPCVLAEGTFGSETTEAGDMASWAKAGSERGTNVDTAAGSGESGIQGVLGGQQGDRDRDSEFGLVGAGLETAVVSLGWLIAVIVKE
jgi:hypothetical protein